MGYADEEYLMDRNQNEDKSAKEEYEEVKENVSEGEALAINYITQQFLEGKIQLELPEDTMELERDVIEFAFMGNNKPEYVTESASSKIAYGYNYTQVEIDNDDIFRFANVAAKILEKEIGRAHV